MLLRRRPFLTGLALVCGPRRVAQRAFAAADNFARVCADMPRRRLPPLDDGVVDVVVVVEPEADEPPISEASRASNASI